VGAIPQALRAPFGEAVSVSSLATSRRAAVESGYKKTSSRARPSLYAAGLTLNPARRGDGSVAWLTTNPACVSRFSTLHKAQSPVRGQAALGVLVPEVGGVSTAALVVATEAESAEEASGRACPHPSANTATIAGNFRSGIDCKDREIS